MPSRMHCYFEACLPVEVIAGRGIDSLRFGPMRPVGLIDPKTGKRPLRRGAAPQGEPERRCLHHGGVPDKAHLSRAGTDHPHDSGALAQPDFSATGASTGTPFSIRPGSSRRT